MARGNHDHEATIVMVTMTTKQETNNFVIIYTIKWQETNNFVLKQHPKHIQSHNQTQISQSKKNIKGEA
jgi:hypothetical protein